MWLILGKAKNPERLAETRFSNAFNTIAIRLRFDNDSATTRQISCDTLMRTIRQLRNWELLGRVLKSWLAADKWCNWQIGCDRAYYGAMVGDEDLWAACK